MIVRLQEAYLSTLFGKFLEVLYYDGQKESIALVMGNVKNAENVLCRVHSSCMSAHIFNSTECDCREQMEMSQFLIEREGRGIVIWLDQEGKGNGHLALLSSAPLREEGLGQTEAYEKLGYRQDARDFTRAAEIIADLGIRSIIMLTNNPVKINELTNLGVKVSGSKEIYIDAKRNSILRKTYEDKILRGHLIKLQEEPPQQEEAA